MGNWQRQQVPQVHSYDRRRCQAWSVTSSAMRFRLLSSFASSFAVISISASFNVIPRAIKRLFHQASIGDQSYRFMFERERTDEVVAIDCETTGLNVRTDDIITIAAIKIRGNRILTSERFEAVVRPEADMQPEAIKVHRLRQRDVSQSPLIQKALPSLLQFVGRLPR